VVVAADHPEILFEVGNAGSRVAVVLGEFYSPLMAHLPGHGWRRVRIEVEAAPFSGTISEVLTEEDMSDYRARAAEFASGARRVRFGGGRAAEITLERRSDVVEASVTRIGDDRYPRVTFLIF
jgi:hypothetical protein